MTEAELFVYLVRDLKWVNGNLKIFAERLTKGEDIRDLIDFSNDEKRNQWLDSIAKETDKSIDIWR